ncbi:MAG: hypothetical protein RIT45_1603 [Pseudomonadota bacterium]|jgi:hypothetical protein
MSRTDDPPGTLAVAALQAVVDAATSAVEVYVEPSDALPDGASLRYKTAGPERAVHAVRYESDDGEAGEWDVWSPAPDGDPMLPAAPVRGVEVHDSSAGISLLVYGGPGGLRLRWREDPSVIVAEAWLLLGPDDTIPHE